MVAAAAALCLVSDECFPSEMPESAKFPLHHHRHWEASSSYYPTRVDVETSREHATLAFRIPHLLHTREIGIFDAVAETAVPGSAAIAPSAAVDPIPVAMPS